LDDILEEYEKPKNQRIMKSANKRLPIDHEALLIQAGVLLPAPPQEEGNFWDFHRDSNWFESGVANKFYCCQFIKDGTVTNPTCLDIFSNKYLLTETFVTNAYVISPPLLESAFQVCLKTFEGRIRAREKLFKKDDWKLLPNAAQRKRFLDRFEEVSMQYSWNQQEKLKIVPVFQHLDENEIWKNCENGFTHSQESNKYYGKGVYFTTDLHYALEKAVPNAKNEKVILVSLIIPGNIFPVTDHPFLDDEGRSFHSKSGIPENAIPNPMGLLDKGVRGGYQSHYTIIYKCGPDEGFPIKGSYDRLFHADQLVIFQDSQVLPLFMVHYVLPETDPLVEKLEDVDL